MIARVHTHNHLNNIALKIFALSIGYSLWYIFSQQQIISVSLSAPLCFDTANDSRIITAPEAVNVTIAGTRQSLAAIDFETYAIHVNVDNLSSSKHEIALQNKNLFLPTHVNLINYEPAPLKITINDRLTSDEAQQGVHE